MELAIKPYIPPKLPIERGFETKLVLKKNVEAHRDKCFNKVLNPSPSIVSSLAV